MAMRFSSRRDLVSICGNASAPFAERKYVTISVLRMFAPHNSGMRDNGSPGHHPRVSLRKVIQDLGCAKFELVGDYLCGSLCANQWGSKHGVKSDAE